MKHCSHIPSRAVVMGSVVDHTCLGPGHIDPEKGSVLVGNHRGRVGSFALEEMLLARRCIYPCFVLPCGCNLVNETFACPRRGYSSG